MTTETQIEFSDLETSVDILKSLRSVASFEGFSSEDASLVKDLVTSVECDPGVFEFPNGYSSFRTNINLEVALEGIDNVLEMLTVKWASQFATFLDYQLNTFDKAEESDEVFEDKAKQFLSRIELADGAIDDLKGFVKSSSNDMLEELDNNRKTLLDDPDLDRSEAMLSFLGDSSQLREFNKLLEYGDTIIAKTTWQLNGILTILIAKSDKHRSIEMNLIDKLNDHIEDVEEFLSISSDPNYLHDNVTSSKLNDDFYKDIDFAKTKEITDCFKSLSNAKDQFMKVDLSTEDLTVSEYQDLMRYMVRQTNALMKLGNHRKRLSQLYLRALKFVGRYREQQIAVYYNTLFNTDASDDVKSKVREILSELTKKIGEL